MKKILTIFVVVSILASCLCGCLSDSNDKTNSVTLEETVIYNENNITVTATGLESSWIDRELKLQVENNSDKDIYITGYYFAVNGISFDTYLSVTVAAGKKAYTSIYLDGTERVEAGIERIASISGYDLYIYDDDSYNYETGAYDTLDQFSFTVETSAAADYVQKIDESGDVIYQESGITVIAREFSDDFWGTTIQLLIKNETDQNLNVTVADVSVNDYMISGWLDAYVCKGTVQYCEMNLYDYDLEEADIEQIEKVAFSLVFLDTKTYDVLWESDEMEITVNEE